MKPVIIYISGAPGSGKTTLARALSKQLNIPHISSDLVHGGVAFTHLNHDRSKTIHDVFIPHMIQTSKLGISFVVDQVLQKNMAKETIIDRLQEHATVVYIHTHTADPIARYKSNIETHESEDVKSRSSYLLERAKHHSTNLENTMYKIELGIPTLEVNTDNGYNPSLEDIIGFIHSQKTI